MSADSFPSLALAAALTLTLACSDASRVEAGERDTLPTSAEETTPLATGDAAPAFDLRNVEGEVYRFDPQNLERPTVLISFRGGWCPYCNLHLSELRTVVPELKQEGFDVLFLSGDAPEQLYSDLAQETQDDIAGLDYTILSDAEIQAALAFGTAFSTDPRLNDYLEGKNYEYAEGSVGKHSALSVPYVYVVDTEGQIVFDFVEPDYRKRLPADDLLAAARKAR